MFSDLYTVIEERTPGATNVEALTTDTETKATANYIVPTDGSKTTLHETTLDEATTTNVMSRKEDTFNGMNICASTSAYELESQNSVVRKS